MSEPAIQLQNVSKTYKMQATAASVTSIWRRRRMGDMQVTGPDYEDEDEDELIEEEPEERPTTAREVPALIDISFDVQPGARLAILGPPASGKTTLLKLLARVTPPTAGRAVVRGRVAPLLELASSFMDPYSTGRANAFQLGRLLGVPHSVVSRRMDDIFALADMSDKVDHLAGTYSSSHFRRIGVATVLNLDADVILVDDRLIAGDPEFAERCVQHIKRAAENGATLLFAARHEEDAAVYCNEALWLAGGRVLERGSLTETAVPGFRRPSRTDRPPGLRALSADQADVLEDLLTEGGGYAGSAARRGLDPDAVRRLAHEAFDALAPDNGRLDEAARAAIADHLLHEPSPAAAAVFARPEARAWARMLTILVGPLAPGALADYPRRAPDPQLAATYPTPPLAPSAAAFGDFLKVAVGEPRALDAISMAADKAVWKDLLAVKWADIAEAADVPHDEAKDILDKLLTLRSHARLGEPERHAFDGRVSLLGASLLRPTGERVEALRIGEPAFVETIVETDADDVTARVEVVLDDGVRSVSLEQPEPFTAAIAGRYRIRARVDGVALRDARYTARVVLIAELEGREAVLETSEAFAFEAYGSAQEAPEAPEVVGPAPAVAWEISA